MAVSDQQFQQLLNSLNELTRNLKNDKNTFSVGSSDNSNNVRTGRGGASNGRSAQTASNGIDVLAKELADLHKSLKSGGTSLADHFKEMVKNVNPLHAAFSKLEEVVDDATKTQSRVYAMAAKKTLEYVKSVGGNVDKLKELNQDYAELVDGVNDLVNNQEHYADNQEIVNQKLAKIATARVKVEKEFGKNVVSGPVNLFLKNLGKNVKTTKLSDNAQTGVNSLNKQFNAVNDISKKFLTDMTTTVKDAQAEFTKSVNNFTKSTGAALLKDAKEVPNFISSRLRYGFESNEFMDAFRMGMSTDELNQMRSSNRDILNALSGFGTNLDFVSTTSLRQWADNGKQVGLIGQEAAQFTSDWMRNAYNTGRTYNDTLNKELTNQAQIVQQAFGGSIQESAKMIQDYTSQIYNISKFNRTQSKEQQAILQKELTTRMLYTKYMGYDVEYMKQQEQMRHNAQFGDIAERIRGAVMGEVSSMSLSRTLGWSDEESQVWSKSRRPGAQLNSNEQSMLLKLNSDVSKYKQGYEQQASSSSSVGGFIGSLVPNIVNERLMQGSGGDSLEGITNSDIKAQAQRNARGDISFEQYLKTMEKGADEQRKSISQIELYVQEIAESMKGFGSLPGAALAGAIGGGVTQILGAVLKRRLATGALSTVMGGSKASTVGAVAKSAIPTAGRAAIGARLAAPVLGAGGVAGAASATAGVAGAGLAGWAAGTGLSKWGQDAYHSDNTAYKMASQVLNPLGYGATTAGNYFSNSNGDSWLGISDRVSKTGAFTEDDIKEYTRMQQVGKWFTSDEEDKADREAAITQLNQLASYQRKRNSVPKDASRSNAISVGVDGMNGVVRDVNGNPISQSGTPDPINKLVEINQKQLDVALQDQTDKKLSDERQEALAGRRLSVQEHMDNLVDTSRSRFTVG